MIFGLIRLAITLTGLTVIAYFGLGWFGYEFNWEYFQNSRAACEEHLRQCRKDLVRTGIDGAKETCDWKCIDPKLFIKKQEEESDTIKEEGSVTE